MRYKFTLLATQNVACVAPMCDTKQTALTLTLTPPLHKSAECTKLLFWDFNLLFYVEMCIK